MALAMVALWLCPVHWGVRFLLMLVTVAGGIKIFLPSRQSTSITFCEDESWLLLLVVLAIKPVHGRTRFAIAWRDSLSACDFSALHIRLALTPAYQLQ